MLVLGLALTLYLLPPALWQGPESRVLPVLTLSTAYVAYIARLTRGGMLEVLRQDYIRTARAKGLPGARSWWCKHALRLGILPVVSYLGPAAARVIMGSIVVESIFAMPGLGRYLVNAAFNRDYTLVLGWCCSTPSFLHGAEPADRHCLHAARSARGAGVSDSAATPPALARCRSRRLPAAGPASLWSDAWKRLRRNRAAVLSALFLACDRDHRGRWRPWLPACSDPTAQDLQARRHRRRRPRTGSAPTSWAATRSHASIYGGRISLMVGLVATLVSLRDRRELGRDRRATAAARSTSS